MRKLFLPVLLSILFLGCAPAIKGAETRTLRIGIVDIQRILRESRAAKEARALFLKDLEARRRLYRAEEEKVRLMSREIKEQTPRLSPEEKKDKLEQMEKEIKELRRLKMDLEEELKKRNAELTQKLLKEIKKVVEAFTLKEGYTLILEKRRVVAADQAIDITDQIIRLYDARASP